MRSRPIFYPTPLPAPAPALNEPALILLWFYVEVAAYRMRTGYWPRLAAHDYPGGWGL